MALTLFLGRLTQSHIFCFRKALTTITNAHRYHQGSSTTLSKRSTYQPLNKCRYRQGFASNHGIYMNRVMLVEHLKVRTLMVSQSGIQKSYSVYGVPQCLVRHMSKGQYPSDKRASSILIYICAVGIFMLGMSYAGVPLYRMFCQATGLGGQATKGHDSGKVESMSAVKNRIIRVRFNADVASSMRWNFKPQQTEVKVLPGETALAFYTAKNPTDKPIIGISTYNVVPFEAGQYFNKIQCFCFEEQRLNPHEEVDMPVFFFIDPEYAEDPKLETIDTITLSYTFFEAKEGLQLPLPGYATS